MFFDVDDGDFGFQLSDDMGMWAIIWQWTWTQANFTWCRAGMTMTTIIVMALAVLGMTMTTIGKSFIATQIKDMQLSQSPLRFQRFRTRR